MVFQFARIGNDTEAEEFLRWLDETSAVSDYVDTLSGSDLMDVIGAREATGKNYQAEDLRLVCAHAGRVSCRMRN